VSKKILDQREDLHSVREAQKPIRREGSREIKFPDGVTLIDTCICAGRLFAATDAGMFEVVDGAARPLGVLGAEEGKEWAQARQDLASRAAENRETFA
jgi:hypothetical protein